MKYGYDFIPEEWKNGEPEQPTNVRYIARYSPQIFALALTELLQQEGVEILFDCLATRPVMNTGHCEGLLLESKSGREFYPAGIVIDTTGDADLLFPRRNPPPFRGKTILPTSVIPSRWKTAERPLRQTTSVLRSAPAQAETPIFTDTIIRRA